MTHPKPRKINSLLLQRIIEKFGSQIAFATYLGIDASIISRTITYRWNLTDEEKKQWADALDQHVNKLFIS